MDELYRIEKNIKSSYKLNIIAPISRSMKFDEESDSLSENFDDVEQLRDEVLNLSASNQEIYTVNSKVQQSRRRRSSYFNLL